MRWLELSIQASGEAAEALAALFHRWGHGGAVVEPRLQRSGDADQFALADDAAAVVRTYLPEGRDLKHSHAKISEAIGILQAFQLAPIGTLQERWLTDEDWLQAWKRHYNIQRIGRRWVIKPRWLDFQPGPKHRVIELDPGMAFGTGLHPTTRSCLELLEDLDVAGRDVLDLGTGSGILAIAAARLGASSVVALDVDEIAVRAATDNVRGNAVVQTVHVLHGTLGEHTNTASLPFQLRTVVPQAQFHVVLANLVARTIAAKAADIGSSLRPAGALVASGIIADREHQVLDALARAQLTIDRRVQRGDWVTLVACHH